MVKKIDKHNVLTTFLSLLNIKYTKYFTYKYFNQHPHKYNLYGISKMLKDYNIENAATKIIDKTNDIYDIEIPFIAHLGHEFVVVYKIKNNEIFYIWNQKLLKVYISEFIDEWSGIILLANTTTNSIEPNYKENRKKNF